MKSLLSIVLFLTLCAASPALDIYFQFNDVEGKVQAPFSATDKKGVVLIFVSPYCPTSNAFTPEINRIAADYADKFAFYLVEADAEISSADARKHVETLEIKAPVLLDPRQRLVKLTKAHITPEAVVLVDQKPLYQGRVNDLYATQTKKLKEPKTNDLRDALDAISAGKPVATPVTKAIGCEISAPQE